MIYVRIGQKLKKRRIALRLSQSNVADECGVSFQQIQKYEGGITGRTIARLWQLADVLDVPIDYFFEDP
jgi:transcriptional regulator with XRE-family HTH domain